jgi:hypothetical protein
MEVYMHILLPGISANKIKVIHACLLHTSHLCVMLPVFNFLFREI